MWEKNLITRKQNDGIIDDRKRKILMKGQGERERTVAENNTVKQQQQHKKKN